jgi:hypothetical protein
MQTSLEFYGGLHKWVNEVGGVGKKGEEANNRSRNVWLFSLFPYFVRPYSIWISPFL